MYREWLRRKENELQRYSEAMQTLTARMAKKKAEMEEKQQRRQQIRLKFQIFLF